ncbi:hypothetical protein MPTK1_6g01930 [Marchantia polymorpha subsp. ruderalis]|uniref:Uncharacterized protein n=2 Tax=Marchantia polymorpha TaxID=3197 RepID=A0AAF6BMK6_MARPO|nr:hypothetical protein MARPO_0052s0011 [Marchantia polymorpha]BBN13240.1 hypothetical protein Mp_6g01930 [Marchantia polymorpha subsp. ruderalis]|eukprot:PTQ38206.1 hypothetical protein MARPO_0052s0011 [Marchantia polymorpha]
MGTAEERAKSFVGVDVVKWNIRKLKMEFCFRPPSSDKRLLLLLRKSSKIQLFLDGPRVSMLRLFRDEKRQGLTEHVSYWGKCTVQGNQANAEVQSGATLLVHHCLRPSRSERERERTTPSRQADTARPEWRRREEKREKTRGRERSERTKVPSEPKVGWSAVAAAVLEPDDESSGLSLKFSGKRKSFLSRRKSGTGWIAVEESEG